MRNRFATLFAVGLLAALPCAAPVFANAVATVENAGEALVFRPVIEAEAMTLTVSGPCDYRSESTEKGEMAFKLDDETADGRYKYSLVATPVLDRRLRRVLLKARESGDERTVRELCREGRLPDAEAMTQTGSFMVLEGRIIFDDVSEAKRRSDRDDGE